MLAHTPSFRTRFVVIILAVQSHWAAGPSRGSAYEDELVRTTLLRQQVEASTSAAYQAAASKLLLNEVTRLAQAPELPDQIPLKSSAGCKVFVRSPAASLWHGHFGTVKTSNYEYNASRENKVCYVEAMESSPILGKAYRDSIRQKYSASPITINTNAAYDIARRWLAAASVNLAALERDCRVEVGCEFVGDRPVPIYTVEWRQPDAFPLMAPRPSDGGFDTVVTVRLVEPDHRLLLMRVENPRYLGSRPLIVPDVEKLMQQSEDSATRKYWLTTNAYHEAAFDKLLAELNELGPKLGIDSHFPLTRSNLTRVIIKPPFAAEQMGDFGEMDTDQYRYYADTGCKLSAIQLNRTECDLYRYYASLKAKWKAPMSQLNTNAAYTLAAGWLSAMGVDVKAMERDLAVRIEPWNINKAEFVPVYRITWGKSWKEALKDAAFVEVVEPDKIPILLVVKQPPFIKRNPLKVDGRERSHGTQMTE